MNHHLYENADNDINTTQSFTQPHSHSMLLGEQKSVITTQHRVYWPFHTNRVALLTPSNIHYITLFNLCTRATIVSHGWDWDNLKPM